MPNPNTNPTTLTPTLGHTELGTSVTINIPKLSHILISGIVGTEKSGLLRSIVAQLMDQNSPENLRLVISDPKKVEFKMFNNIPHLLTPVVTDSKKTVMVLRWIKKEIQRRLDIFESSNVRDIESYLGHFSKKSQSSDTQSANSKNAQSKNTKTKDSESMDNRMQYIIVALDSLSDMVTEYPNEFDNLISAVSESAHIVGIHIVATLTKIPQKITTKSIASTITSAFPTRVSFRQASVSDSLIAIGGAGAERLSATDEALFQSLNMKFPVYLKLSKDLDNDTSDTLKNIKQKYKSDIYGNYEVVSSVEEDDIDDDLYDEAKAVVLLAGKASTSYIQRKLRIGYARSARLIDILEAKGIIGPADGSAPRKVISDGK